MVDFYQVERTLSFFITISAYTMLTIAAVASVVLIYDVIKEVFYDNRKSSN